MEINKVAVIGGGTMGNGIVHVFAMNGYTVSLVEMNQLLADKAVQNISKNLDRQIAKEIITAGDRS
jgi:3-hydroxybutyryl-CoA dehydrogenase